MHIIRRTETRVATSDGNRVLARLSGIIEKMDTAMSLEAAIALNRFGLGARPGELARLNNPRRHLLAQLERPELAQINEPGLLSSTAAVQVYREYRMQRRADRRTNADSNASMQANPGQNPPANGAEARALQQQVRRTLGNEAQARVRHGIETDAGFLERWVLFWSNHFTMAATGANKVPYAGPFEREAIRPHVLGKFTDLLVASTTHPGMLVYLDQAQSIGPNSPAASRARAGRRERGLNENLAREVLELHTIGSHGGYTQADVTEFARALTGWTIANERTARFAPQAEEGAAIFAPPLHEPGTRRVLGRSYGQNGQAQALAILADLAARPETARKIAGKIARHFIADEPPATLVSRLEQSFRSTGGDLAALARTLVESPESWAAQQSKFKTPLDFMLSAMRAGPPQRLRNQALRDTFEQLGQAAFRAPSPEGWPDDAASWAGPDALLKRVDWSAQIAEQIGDTTTALAFLESALGPTLSDRTRTAISRAESQKQAITLALMSPEFQRR